MTDIYNLEVKDIDLNLIKLDQYKGLQSIDEKYKD